MSRRRVDVDPSVERPGERMQLELEARRDAEVRAGATEAPEQLRLLVRARPDEAPVGGHELDRAKAVDRQPEPPLEPADAAAERQPGDARVADDPHRDRRARAPGPRCRAGRAAPRRRCERVAAPGRR